MNNHLDDRNEEGPDQENGLDSDETGFRRGDVIGLSNQEGSARILGELEGISFGDTTTTGGALEISIGNWILSSEQKSSGEDEERVDIHKSVVNLKGKRLTSERSYTIRKADLENWTDNSLTYDMDTSTRNLWAEFEQRQDSKIRSVVNESLNSEQYLIENTILPKMIDRQIYKNLNDSTVVKEKTSLLSTIDEHYEEELNTITKFKSVLIELSGLYEIVSRSRGQRRVAESISISVLGIGTILASIVALNSLNQFLIQPISIVVSALIFIIGAGLTIAGISGVKNQKSQRL